MYYSITVGCWIACIPPPILMYNNIVFQWAVGLLAYLLPCCGTSVKEWIMPFHRWMGEYHSIFVLQ